MIPEKKDLRIKRTYHNLTDAMLALLGYRNFDKITVSALCEEALISRATFYDHFSDKYNLLDYLLKELKKDFIIRQHDYTNEQMEMLINQFIAENAKIIQNLLTGANDELLELVYSFMSPAIDLSAEEEKNREMSSSHVILSEFYTGGMLKLLLWQVKNKFPPETQMMTHYFSDLLKCIMEWDSNQG